jgi:hypothetical protein
VKRRSGVSVFATALSLLATIAVQASPMASAVDCAQSAGLLARVPGYIVKTITPADAGPGSADTAELCGVAAAELQNASSKLRDDH